MDHLLKSRTLGNIFLCFKGLVQKYPGASPGYLYFWKSDD